MKTFSTFLSLLAITFSVASCTCSSCAPKTLPPPVTVNGSQSTTTTIDKPR